MLKSRFACLTMLFFVLPFFSDHFNTSVRAATTATHAYSQPSHDSLRTHRGKINELRVSPPKNFGIKKVVIDAGHGGHDPGCLGSSSYEKTIALNIALQLGELLRTHYPDLQVILTRDSDVFIPLHKRAQIANQSNADLFLSIHCNFIPKASHVHGSETYVLGPHRMQENLEVAMRENSAILLEDNYEENYDYDPNSPEGHIILSMYQNAYLEQSILFAGKVEQQMAGVANLHSRGVKQAGFLVLRATAMPSVLIETGFLSNSLEEEYLMSETGQLQVAQAILLAFHSYKSEMEGTDTPPPVLPVAMNQLPESMATNPKVTPASQSTTEQPQPKPQTLAIDTPQIAQTYAATPAQSPTTSSIASATPPPTDLYEKSPATGGTLDAPGHIQFRVQLAASPQPIETNFAHWREVGYLVQVVQEDGLYKYQARNFDTLDAASEARAQLRQRGFTDAFVVAYKDGLRISVTQAKRELGLR